MTTNTTSPTAALARFASALRFDDIPPAVVERACDLMLDWVGSALAGKGARAVETIERFAAAMGPASGGSEVLISRRSTSPLFAAMVNGAASHFAEQDDVHNGSVFHPAAVVFPPALAVAQALRCPGRDLLTAAVAGYEVGIRVGEFLGRSHYKVFHTTGTAGTVAAAAAAGRLLAALAYADAARVRIGGHAGGRPVGVPARRGRFEATAHGKGVRRWPARGIPCEGRLHGRDEDPRRRAGDGSRHVERRRSREADRPARRALGTGRDLVQVPRVVSSHAPGRRRAARRRRRARARAGRHRGGHRACSSGGDRCAGTRGFAVDCAPGEVLDGHSARADRDVPQGGARRVPAALRRRGDRRVPQEGDDGARSPRSIARIRTAGSAR